MKKSTVIVLAVVAAGLFAYIMAFERDSLSTSEVRGRAARALPRLVRDRVTKLEIQRGDTRVVLEREREEEEELGTWRMTAPVATAADEDAVDGLLSAMEFLEPRRRLEEVSASDLDELGFDEPRHRLWFTAGDERVAILIGGDDARGQGVYLRVEDRDQVFVVGRDFVEAIDHDADHFRQKKVFPEFRTSDVRELRLRRGGESFRIARRDGSFWLEEPERSMASSSAVEDMLGALRELSATRFVEEEAADLARYGLDAPYRELRAERPEEVTAHRIARLRVGGPCEEHEGERYALAGDGRANVGPVVCVRESALSSLDASLDRLRERRLITSRDDQVERIRLRAGGRTLSLHREGEGWKLQVGSQEEVGADAESVGQWLRALRELRVASLEPADEANLEARGLGPAQSAQPEITIERGEEEGQESLILGASDEVGIYLRRGEEPSIVRLDPSPAIAPLFEASPLRFRDRRLVRDLPNNAQSLEVQRGGERERVTRADGGFRLSAPIEEEADRVAARELARRMATLRAERFVAEAAQPEHGLAQPRWVVHVRFEGSTDLEEDPDGEGEEHPGEGEGDGEEPREVELRIGAATEGGAFAQLGSEGAVFVVSEGLIGSVEGPLVSRDLLSVGTEAISRLELRHGPNEAPEIYRRDGVLWRTGEGEAADSDRINGVLDRLSTLRASGAVAYGAPAPELGLDPPTHLLVVERAQAPEGEEATLRVRIGEPQGEGEELWYPVRREGLDVTYRFRPEAVRPFLPR